jgi:hypothetical protein
MNPTRYLAAMWIADARHWLAERLRRAIVWLEKMQ